MTGYIPRWLTNRSRRSGSGRRGSGSGSKNRSSSRSGRSGKRKRRRRKEEIDRLVCNVRINYSLNISKITLIIILK